MRDAITATFKNDYNCAKEATLAASPFMESTTIRLVRNMQSWALLILAIGGLFALGYSLIEPSARITSFYILIGSILGAFVISYASLPFAKKAYHQFCDTPFGSGATVVIAPNGFELQTQNSTWFTGWGDVTEVFMTPNTCGIITPSMPIYVPKTALDDPQATFAAMRRWHMDAKA